MERKTCGLDFRELDGLEVLEEVEFQAVEAAHAKALRPNRALCCRQLHTPVHLECQAKELVSCPKE